MPMILLAVLAVLITGHTCSVTVTHCTWVFTKNTKPTEFYNVSQSYNSTVFTQKTIKCVYILSLCEISVKTNVYFITTDLKIMSFQFLFLVSVSKWHLEWHKICWDLLQYALNKFLNIFPEVPNLHITGIK